MLTRLLVVVGGWWLMLKQAWQGHDPVWAVEFARHGGHTHRYTGYRYAAAKARRTRLEEARRQERERMRLEEDQRPRPRMARVG